MALDVLADHMPGPGAAGEAGDGAPPDSFRRGLFLFLRVGDRRYAVPVGCVREIVDGARLAPAAADDPAIVGSFRSGGRPVPVLRLGDAPLGRGSGGTLVVVDADGGLVGLAVDAVTGVGDIGRLDARSARPGVRGTVLVGATYHDLLDPAALVAGLGAPA